MILPPPPTPPSSSTHEDEDRGPHHHQIIERRQSIAYFVNVNETTEATFVAEIREILHDVETYQSKLQTVLANRHLFNWKHSYPFDAYMYMLGKHLFPNTTRNLAEIFGAQPQEDGSEITSGATCT